MPVTRHTQATTENIYPTFRDEKKSRKNQIPVALCFFHPRKADNSRIVTIALRHSFSGKTSRQMRESYY